MLAGAYTVGESVRGSLRDLVLARIGNTDHALFSSGFFRESLVPECSLISLEAVVTNDSSGSRASRVAVYGVDQRFFEFHRKVVKPPGRSEFLISEPLAREIGVQTGAGVLIRVPKASAIPTESLHGHKEDSGRTIRGTMREAVARQAMGEFSLRPQQGPVRAVFMNLQRLQRDLELDGRVNTGLFRGKPGELPWSLEDIGVRLRNGAIQHESMVMNDVLVRAVQSVGPAAQPVFAYLANSVRAGNRVFPYSLIAALDRPELQADSEIVLNQWAARDLQVKIGDQVSFDYYVWDPSGRLLTKTADFRLSRIVPIAESDRYLAPEYPGISDVESMSDWDPPFPMDLGAIRPKDEQYWDRYRGTPKAFIKLAAGQQLWRSRFGQVTSIRVGADFSLDTLRSAIDPFQAGLTLENVRQRSLQASQGATDFAQYFVYFSFFLVVSALLLAGLFFRLGIESRMQEIATLRALGFSIKQIRRVQLIEGLLVASAGCVLGIVGALLYAGLIVHGLRTWWIDAVGTRDLKLHFTPLALLAGVAGGLLVGLFVIVLSLRIIRERPVRDASQRPARGRVWAAVLAIAGLAMLGVGGAGGFFGAGALLLAAAVAFLWDWLRHSTTKLSDVRKLGFRYAAYRPGRSVLSVALIASATFLIVSIDSFRRASAKGEEGYRFYGESALALFHDPNTREGKEALNLPADLQARWLQFRLRPGEDASCLNLYQPQNPRVLGVPETWLKIEGDRSDGTIPAAVDENTLMYALHKKVGDVIEVGGAKLRIVRGLQDSIFQSEVLISNTDFQRAYPEEQGYRVFLVDAVQGFDGTIENALSDYGIDLVTTASRREAYHRVENTYLSTFQALGGLGLVLGTIGLAAILLRNVLERRRELGLLRAVGYNHAHLSRMILAENAFLLGAGLAIGIICALVAIAPSASQRGGSIPLVAVALLVVAVFITGVAASWIAVRLVVRSPLLASIRSE